MEEYVQPSFIGIKSIKRVENEDVYCLSAPKHSNFVANGIVVRNCDALRYVCHTHFGKRSKLKETSKEELAAKRFAANPMAAQGLGAGAYGWQSMGMGR